MISAIRSLRERLRRRIYNPLNLIEISQSALTNNYQALSNFHPQIKIAPVIKSNAYGHGIAEATSVLQKLTPPFFCVDSVYEAQIARKFARKTPILVMGYLDPVNLQHLRRQSFSFAVFDLDFAKALNKFHPGTAIHIFVDTGMNREGVLLSELKDFILEIKKLKNLRVEGLMTHFASADDPSKIQTKEQEKSFTEAQNILKDQKICPKYIHCSASAGLFSAENSGCNLARIGKALYGITPGKDAEGRISLQPVLKFTTKIAEIKTIPKGSAVGYSATFKAPRKMTIAILPAGYYDGIDRRLSNKGVVQIDCKLCPIIGRISMNITTIDISELDYPRVGEEVSVISDNPQDPNSIEHIAKLAETIPLEILVHLQSSTRRVIV